MKVDSFSTREADDGIERSARVRWAGGEVRLWITVPADLAGDAGDASPFVCPALLPAMRLGEDLEVDGAVSARLVRGLAEARDLYRAWAPSLHPAALRVAEERAPASRAADTACFFSRGVDSTYSAALPRTYPAPLTRLVFVDRLEPAHTPDVRAEEIRLAKEAAARIGLPLSVVSTNVRELTDPIVHDWEDMAGGGLALVALAMAGGAGRVVIPSSQGPLSLEPCGTGALLDHLFSTETVDVHHDSVARSRVAKALWLADARPDLAAGLKVCYAENRPDNCGRCAKCLLTMATLEAAGMLHAALYFPREIDLEAVAGLSIHGLRGKVEWAELAAALDAERHPSLRAAALAVVGGQPAPYPGLPILDESPAFGKRQNSLTVALIRDGRPWPPLQD